MLNTRSSKVKGSMLNDIQPTTMYIGSLQSVAAARRIEKGGSYLAVESGKILGGALTGSYYAISWEVIMPDPRLSHRSIAP